MPIERLESLDQFEQAFECMIAVGCLAAVCVGQVLEFFQSEKDRWAKIIHETGAKVD